jgi:hypothetical protein
MKIAFCENRECARPFQINDYHPRDRVELTSGVIACPHCATLTTADAQTVFLTHALSRTEEEQFLAAHRTA